MLRYPHIFHISGEEDRLGFSLSKSLPISGTKVSGFLV